MPLAQIPADMLAMNNGHQWGKMVPRRHDNMTSRFDPFEKRVLNAYLAAAKKRFRQAIRAWRFAALAGQLIGGPFPFQPTAHNGVGIFGQGDVRAGGAAPGNLLSIVVRGAIQHGVAHGGVDCGFAVFLDFFRRLRVLIAEASRRSLMWEA
jgi:hypothetical protein